MSTIFSGRMGKVVLKLTKVEDGHRKHIDTKRGPQPGIWQRGTKDHEPQIAQDGTEAIRHKTPAKPVGGVDPVVAIEAVAGGNRIIGGGSEG